MSYALLFAGQGLQHPGMLPWLVEDDAVRRVQAVVGADWRTRLADRAWAGRNAHAQPLLTGLSLAAWAQLAPLLPAAPAAMAGYSVGELAAFAAAGAFDAATALALSIERAAWMDRCAASQSTGLLGVSGWSGPAFEAWLQRFGLVVAIRNGVDSVVAGGLQSVLPAAAEAAQQQGAHCTLLNVQVASHTPWMAEAARGFARLIAPMAFSPVRGWLFSNAAGRVASVPQLKQALATQIDHTVRWDECMDAIAGRQVACVLEVGPGQALARLWSQRHPGIPARSADDFRSARAVADWIARHGG
ncbi:acyltransferase domain-containing protein [Aquincola sp. MAHUQ-54]|uniref:Acyltransferase domain-containing protein n=1 Tax=Aquincola agrisoli TaxID=3119538 RepID=A0AAW9QPA0_9BURK